MAVCRRKARPVGRASSMLPVYPLRALLPAAQEVGVHGQQYDRALDDVLPVGVDAHQVQAVVQYADDQNADQRAAQLAGAAGHGGAADHDRRDGVHFRAVAGGAGAGVQAGGDGDARQAGHQAAEAEHHEFDLRRVDAREGGGGVVAAHGVDVPADAGAVQEQHRDDEHDGHGDDGGGHARHVARAQELPGVGHAADGLALGIDVGDALGDVHRGQRDDERRDLGLGDHQAVQQAEDDAGEYGDQYTYNLRHAVPHHRRRAQHAGHGDDGAHGQVDAAQYDDHGHAAGQHQVGGALAQHVEDVGLGQERGMGSREHIQE